MYLSVQDSDSKRAFILVDLHSLDGGIMQVQLKKGVMDMLVLALLTQNDRYGYEIVSKISEYIELSEGTIYPLFNRLKKRKICGNIFARITNRAIAKILQNNLKWYSRL